jgi:hypothetical protein
LQLAFEQKPAAHFALEQSVSAVQAASAGQRSQTLLPPQSTSLSPPFCTLSLHEGMTH